MSSLVLWYIEIMIWFQVNFPLLNSLENTLKMLLWH